MLKVNDGGFNVATFRTVVTNGAEPGRWEAVWYMEQMAQSPDAGRLSGTWNKWRRARTLGGCLVPGTNGAEPGRWEAVWYLKQKV
jgi:hypothetical protein